MRGFIVAIQRYWLALTILILTAITVGSLWPMDSLPELPGSDKTHHLFGYALLMLPAALRRPRHWMLLALLFVIWSGLIELIQPYVNRYAEWLDLLANTVGVMLGMLIAYLLLWLNDTNVKK